MESLTELNKIKSEALQSTLQTTTAISLSENKFDDIVASVGYSAKDLINKPPIRMLQKSDLSQKVETFLAIQLVKLMESVNLNGNLNMQNYQIPTIAASLVEMYPVESLEDLVLCFKRGAAGFYGTIYRLDAAVICEWMKAYLDEKYTFVENEQARKKNEGIKQDEINYDAFKDRVGDFLAKKKSETNASENEYQRQKLATPYKYYTVRGVSIMATSQEHAEGLIQRLIDMGELVEVDDSEKLNGQGK